MLRLMDLINQLFPRSQNSRQDAKRRLQFVLAHDRVDLTPQVLEQMRQEIMAVIARYVELDTDSVEFSLESDQRITALVANVPIRRVRKEPSIQEDGGDAPENSPLLDAEALGSQPN